MEAAPDGGALSHWGLHLDRARCCRKLGQPAADWLPMIARACHAASVGQQQEEGGCGGGALLPLYALHAARLRLLLALPAAQRWLVRAAPGHSRQWSAEGGAGSGLEEQRELLQLLARYCFLPTTNQALVQGSSDLPCAASHAAAEVPYAPGELRHRWQLLLEDCCAAMQWCLDKDRSFHRAAFRWVVCLSAST